MRDVHILTMFSALLFSLAMLFGDEAVATMEIPIVTEIESPSGFTPAPDLYTKTTPLERLVMSALFAPDASFFPEFGRYQMTAMNTTNEMMRTYSMANGALIVQVDSLGNSVSTAMGPFGAFQIKLNESAPVVSTLAANTSPWASEVERLATAMKAEVFQKGLD